MLWPSGCPFTFSCSFTYIGYLAPELSYFLLWEGEKVCFHVILFFLIFFFFLMWTIFKVVLNLLQYCLCFMFWFFGHKACGILFPRSGIEPTTSAFEGKVLTTRLPEKFPHVVLLLFFNVYLFICLHQVLVAGCGVFTVPFGVFRCGA